MKTLLRFVCLLLICWSLPAVAAEKDLHFNSVQFVDIGVQVQKLSRESFTGFEHNDDSSNLLDHKSWTPCYNGAAKLTATWLDWITWPFENIKNMEDAYYFCMDNVNELMFRTAYPLAKSSNPIMTACVKIFRMIRDFTWSAFRAIWPWNWMDSIEIIGFAWVINYFFYHLLRFAAMDEKTLERLARCRDNAVVAGNDE